MNNHHKIKLIAASVALMASFGAMAGLGGLNVQSRLGEPFSGTITVTGDEAKALLNGGKASISNGNLRASVRKSGSDNAIVSIRSSKPIQDPVLIFQVGVGSQSREYTAIIDPAGYNSKSDGSTRVHSNNQINRVEAAPANSATDRQAARERINRAVANEGVTRKETQSRRANHDGKPANKAVKSNKGNQEYAGIVYGKRHLVRQGETLTGIASRIRPQGMTLAQTAQALVNANPDVFIGNDANRMLAGKVLNIPSRAELRNLASDSPNVQAVQNPTVDSATVATTPVESASATPPTSAPVDTATTVPSQTTASQPAMASAVEVPVDVNASAASDIAASVPASAVEHSEAAVTEPETVAETEGTGLWRWLLLGGAGLLALLFLAKLLGKRKAESTETVAAISDEQNEKSTEGEEDFTEFKSLPETEQGFVSDAVKTAAVVAGAGAVAATATHAVKKADDELEVEDDFGDDIFFTEVEEASVEKQNEVDLDLNSLDSAQGAIVSGAVTRDEETEKRRNADWDAIESTESVYEPEPENPYAFTAPSTDKPVAVLEESSETAEQSEQAWDFEQEQLQEQLVENEAAKEEAEWDFFAQEPEKTESSQAEESALEWDGETVETATVEVQQEVASESIETAAETIEFEPVQIEANEPLAFVAPSVEETAVQEAEEVGAIDTAMPSEPELFDIQQAEALSFQDTEDLKAEVPQVAEADEAIEWDNIAISDTVDSSRRESGFISESVGMTAPLEAKYELAKMYMEIGDPDAARETLQELLEESDGAILVKVKAMLSELDA